MRGPPRGRGHQRQLLHELGRDGRSLGSCASGCIDRRLRRNAGAQVGLELCRAADPPSPAVTYVQGVRHPLEDVRAERLWRDGVPGPSERLLGRSFFASSLRTGGDALVGASALFYSAHVIRLGEYADAIAPLPLARAKAGAQLGYGVLVVLALALLGELDAPASLRAMAPPELATLAVVASADRHRSAHRRRHFQHH